MSRNRIAAVLRACRMSDFDDRDGVELPPKSAQSDDLRTRIAAVQASHHHWDYAGALTCACGEDFGVDNAGWEAAVTDWAQHVADAVIRELEAEPDNCHERLDCIGRWMHPGLWSGLDSRREAILKILKGEMVEPPSWGTPSFDNRSRDD